jgi:hypothetical protein
MELDRSDFFGRSGRPELFGISELYGIPVVFLVQCSILAKKYPDHLELENQHFSKTTLSDPHHQTFPVLLPITFLFRDA